MGILDSFFKAEEASLQKDWKILNQIEQLSEIKEASLQKPIVIFKHSITCGISSMAKYKLEEKWDFQEGEIEFYYLDLLTYRPVSNAVAETFKVVHQSPQILVIKNGEAVYDTSHHMVSVQAIRNAI